jgi:hypothetical protein
VEKQVKFLHSAATVIRASAESPVAAPPPQVLTFLEQGATMTAVPSASRSLRDFYLLKVDKVIKN